MGDLVDDVIFSTSAGHVVIATWYDSTTDKLYVGVTSDLPRGDYIARVDLQQESMSRYFLSNIIGNFNINNLISLLFVI